MALLLNRNIVAGLLSVALSAWLFTLTFGLPQSPFVPIGPEFYPRIVLGLTALLGVAVMVEGILAGRRAAAAAEPSRRRYRAVVLTFAVFGIYILLLPALGFRLSTFLFVLVLQIMIDPPSSRRGWLIACAVAVLTAAVIYAVFQHFLSVLLPLGRWTGF